MTINSDAEVQSDTVSWTIFGITRVAQVPPEPHLEISGGVRDFALRPICKYLAVTARSPGMLPQRPQLRAGGLLSRAAKSRAAGCGLPHRETRRAARSRR
jgi:hypothetical protein